MFVDLKKAFDLGDHQCLLYKLEHYGIRGKSLKWFEDYLKYNHVLSFSFAFGYGVPEDPY